LHHFAKTVIQAGKSYHYENFKRFEIAYYILNLREMGTFARPTISPSGEQLIVPTATRPELVFSLTCPSLLKILKKSG
jgi:hypothetical protein